MTAPHEWEQWEESWREARTTPAELDAMIERTRRARRAILLVRVLSAALAVIALLVVAAALRHAGNRFEMALGLVVSLGVVAVWVLDAINQRSTTEKAEAHVGEYLATRRTLCRRQLRFARLGWIVVGLDLVFLFPWWIGGFEVHGFGFHATQILSMWTPLAAIAIFVTWTLAMRKRARAELQQLTRASDPSTKD